MCSALDIANFFVKIATSDDEEPACLTPLQVQKLVYYAEGWRLAFNDVGFFTESIMAWKHGPVVKSVYRAFSGDKPIAPHSVKMPDLTVEQAAFLSSIWNVYKKYSAWGLREKTHSERPWLEARSRYGPSESSDVAISRDSMKAFFRAEFAAQQSSLGIKGIDIADFSSPSSPARQRGRTIEEVARAAGLIDALSSD